MTVRIAVSSQFDSSVQRRIERYGSRGAAGRDGHSAGGGVESGRPRLRVVSAEGGRPADAEIHRQCGSRRPFARERIDEVACSVLQN